MSNMSNTLSSTPPVDSTKLKEIVPPIYATGLSATLLNTSLADVEKILQTGTPPAGSGITKEDIQALGTVRSQMVQLVRWMTSGEYWTTGQV